MGTENRELSDHIRVIFGENYGKFPFCNVLLVRNCLIDAGAGIGIIKGLLNKANCLILSHTHPDHASGAWVFNEASRKVLAPPDVPTDIESLAVRFVGEKLARVWKLLVTSPPIEMKSFQADRYSRGLVNSDPEIEAIPVPGHSVDHHVFLIEGKILFAADVDLTKFGPFYGNPESDPWIFKQSIEKLLDLDFEVFVSAHSEPVFGRKEIEERILWYLEIFDRRDDKLLGLLERPRSIEELVELSPIYGKKPYVKEMLDFFERNMIEKHLNRLEREGKVRKEGGKYRRV